MKPETTKRIVCEFAIAVMVCGAMHHFVIAPTERQAAEFAAKADAMSAPVVGPASFSAERLGELTSTARRRADEVRTHSRLVEDQTELLAATTEIAERMRIRLERFEPGETRQQAIAAAASADKPAEDGSLAPEAARPPQDTVLTSTLSVTGSYGDVAKFIDALCASVGYTSVSSIRITPTERPGAVAAVINAEHHGFAVPASLARTDDEHGGGR